MGKEIQRVIVDRALQRGGFSSYSELAVRLGVSAPTLSQWRQGINPIPERRLEQLCKLSGDDVGVFRLAIMAEETKITSLRKSIQAVLKDAGRTIPTTALALLVALGANIGTSTNASANSHNGDNNVSQKTPTNRHYAKCSRPAQFKAAAALIGNFLLWLRWRFKRKPTSSDYIEACI